MNACTRCANSHSVKECRFRFSKKCFKCGKWHFSFLCIEPKKEYSKPAKSEETNSGAASTEFEFLHFDNACEACILPTFSALLPSKVCIRALKDSGSQLNFIETDFAIQNQLKVIKSGVILTVKGINSSKQLVTDVVELKLEFGNGMQCIQAICIPQINTKLVLPGLNIIVTDFVRKGYDLADQCLMEDSETDIISNIKLILGTDSDHCMPLNTVLFGEPTPSIYLESPKGIMLSGNVERMLQNLSFLPDKAKPIRFSDINEINPEPLDNYDYSYNLISNVDTNFSIIDEQGKLVQSELKKATDEILKEQCSKILNYEPNSISEYSVENNKLANFVLDSATRAEDGRLVLPLLWNPKVSHLLGKNQVLSRLILKSNFKRYHKDGVSLPMIDQVFKEQERLGIIERVEDLPGFLEEHPNYSFLPHMPVFKTDRETSKCRVVFLSNLSEKDPTKPLTASHNMALLPGPCLNKKISTTLLQWRFDRYLLAFDLQKAFLQIQLPESDQVKLLFYWYRDISKEDFHMVVYKHVRLPFGLRPSPALLLLGLYKMLILDTELDSPEVISLKRQIYDLCYMDNCGVSFNDPEQLKWAYNNLEGIFSKYKLELQQFVTNNADLQKEIDRSLGSQTETPSEVKIFGLNWNRNSDTFSLQKLCLDKQASTKREVLRSIASNFDIFNFSGPLLNRARLFMHELQGMKELGWDTKLPAEKYKEWGNIVKQLNSSPNIFINRFVGERGDQFKLIAFTDSSKLMYGCVI